MNRNKTSVIDLLDEVLIRTVFENEDSEEVALSKLLGIQIVPKPFLGMELLDRLRDRELIEMPPYDADFFERGDVDGVVRLTHDNLGLNSLILAERKEVWKSLKWKGYECCVVTHGTYTELVISELWNSARYHAGVCGIHLEEIYPSYSVLDDISNDLTIGKIVLGIKNALGILKDSGYEYISFDVLINLAIKSIQAMEEEGRVRLGVVEKCTPNSMLSHLFFVDLLGLSGWALEATLPWPFSYWGNKQIKGKEW